MATKQPHETVTLTLTDTPGNDAPFVNRLRSALKSLLRVYGLRCKSVTPTIEEPSSAVGEYGARQEQ